MIKKYELINSEGCLFDTVKTTSIRNARYIFSQSFEGKYIILCEGKRTNIILK
jgi:hypothetical protein